ncbi:MAG: CDP-alcohol phosphatidyltransferase family protein [Desulfobulbaceae bacterium]|jgi:CDP-diacylglycerol--glycerol-3-phosphate 3-phosphatidyltransferase/cardiolipin synthase|nr:CDP-alcohol phosphatidyltransferase family protein [Desulfobulbaceae bacterium]MDY0350573.1 CDP-alcohol phosphatidyltransferase family protein [Desulfobulbaceae bacterium]
MRSFFRHIPNLLSLLRLTLALLLPFSPERCWFWIVLGGGGSDFLDGWIARRWKMETWQGGLLDAVADKVFVLSALLTFVAAGIFSPWWIPAVVARDLTVAAIAAYAAWSGAWASFRKMNSRLSGKAATGGQFLLLMLASLGGAGIQAVLLLAILLSFVAAADYGRQFAAALQAGPADAPRGRMEDGL